MNENIYAAPISDLVVEDETISNEFYIVSLKKFGILFLSTFGTYAIYWFYKNWKMHKAKYNGSLWPVPRAIFNIFFAHSLFKKVDSSIKRDRLSFDWSPSGLATLFVIFTIVNRFIDRLSLKEMGTPWVDIISIPVLFILYIILLKVQKAINISQNDPQGNSNSDITVLNIVWILLGVVLWILFLIGILMSAGILDPNFNIATIG